ncbi:MAG: permease prefix domain 1-containing protein, partial [Bryobacteraceae bacterium]
MSSWLWRLKNLLRRDGLSSERAEEMQVHFDMEVEAGLLQGLSREEARRRARLRAGLVSEAVESTREEMGFRWLDGAAMDVRHALRALIHNRGFGLVAMLVLAASVAINTLVFCLLEGVVLKP